ncbi:DUF1631 family protein [Methylosarcina fibrata]|uniref:DUF1631 family protein n=1 Tax=Methylosarcina fibrata TaxID=105972 RepID=UPI00036D7679
MESFKTVFFHYFEQLVDNCCLRIEPEFSMHLSRGRETLSKEYHKNAQEYLRSIRFEIKANYLLKINGVFDQAPGKKEKPLEQRIHLESTSLVSDDHVQENYTANLIIRECEKIHHEQLTRLNHLMAVLSEKSAAAGRQNPVAPENLIRLLLAVTQPLRFNARQRIALYRAFETLVFNQMGFIYQELIKHCESNLQQGVEPIEKNQEAGNCPLPEAAPLQPIDQEFRQLQLKLAHWRTHGAPPGFDPLNSKNELFYEHFEITNALQVLNQFNLTTGGFAAAEGLPIKRQVLARLDELNFSDEAKTLTQNDEDVLDLISFIFSEIDAHPFLSDSIKSTLAQLEIPLAAVCLGRYGVFTDANHPLRSFLDQLIEAGLFLNFEHESDCSVRQHIIETANSLFSKTGFDLSGWASAAEEFSQFIEKYRENSRVREDNAIRAMMDYETLFSARKAVAEVVADAVRNQSLPPTVTDFLHNVWHPVMVQAYLTRHRQPESWEKSVKAMNQLIVSVTPPIDDAERKRILKFIPRMIKCLRSGLTLISYNREAQSRFFKELAVLQILAMDKKDTKTPEAGAANEETDDTGKIDAESEKQSGSSNPCLILLRIGDWYLFDGSSEKQWGRLARIGHNNENLLFVGKNGEKIVQIETEYLAKQVRLGQAAPLSVDSRSITGRMLSALSALQTTLPH